MKLKTLRTVCVFSFLLLIFLIWLLGSEILFSYLKGAQGMARNALRDSTTLAFDVERLNQQIEALTPTLQRNRENAAELDVEIEYLAQDTARVEANQKLKLAEMRELRRQLGQQEGLMVSIDGKSYNKKSVGADLLRRIKAYQSTEKQLGSRLKLLAERRQTLAKAISAIQENEQEQKLLEDSADSLSAELKLQEIAKVSSEITFQEPALAKTKKLRDEIRKRLEVLKRSSSQEPFLPKVEVNLDRRSAAEKFDELFANSK